MDKLLIFSAPSGSGKTTIVGELMARFPMLEFSVSVTSRAPRGTEIDGREYKFVSLSKFKEYIKKDLFIEYEEVYDGNFYGTLRSQLDEIWEKGHVCIFDIDVKGGLQLKKIYGDNALSFFIKTPSLEELRRRLEKRGTDSPESIERRLAKAASETMLEDDFDFKVVNDDLDRTVEFISSIVSEFIKSDSRADFDAIMKKNG